MPTKKATSYKQLKEQRAKAEPKPEPKPEVPPPEEAATAATLAAAQEAEFQALLAAEEAERAVEAAKVRPATKPAYDGPPYQDKPDHHRHLCLECGTVWEHENGKTDHRCPEPGCGVRCKYADHYKGPVPPSELDREYKEAA